MTTFAEELAAARLECLASQAAAREREYDRPLSATIRELLGARQQRSTDGLAARAALWGAPPVGGSFGRGEAGRGMRTRNARF
jgi:hypothetical protein